MGMLREKIKQNLEEYSSNSLTVNEMVECIHELVNKVCTLESAVSSRNRMVKRLKSEIDGLQTNLKKLEEDREMLIEGSEVTNKKLMELEEELQRVKMFNQSVRTQDDTLQTHFTEASCNLEHFFGKLNNMKPDEEEENLVLYKKKRTTSDDKSGGNLKSMMITCLLITQMSRQ
ncbi:Kinase-interacting protein 1 [Glycine max]|uniref:Kinase-interacting protein 1 n=1 Tax=Glycine soja TaxID=3848 RepID=A0A445KZH5_GLYSO|nr:Kinase-interacting protein 1 [Glycine max]RZC16330.1 Kinase-interacting protein 1 [Glycine soja]